MYDNDDEYVFLIGFNLGSIPILKKDEDYIIGIKVYFHSPDGIVFYCGILDTEVFYRNYIDFSFNAYFVDEYTAKFKHDILDLLIKYAVNEEYA